MKRTSRLILFFSSLTLLAAGALVWHAWWTAYPQGVRPLHAGSDVPAVELTFDATKDNKLTLASGTFFEIPAHAFVASDGTIPTEVNLTVREFMSASDQIRAGIPMQITPGSRLHLQSAGMLEVRANSAGKPLNLRPGVSLDVGLVSHIPAEGDFRLWTLDDAGSWADAGRFQTEENADRNRELARIDSALNSPKPRAVTPPVQEEKQIPWSFELYSDETNAPQLKAWKGVVWDWVPTGPTDTPPVNALRAAWTDATIVSRPDSSYDITVFFEQTSTSGQVTRDSKTLRATPRLNARQRKRTEATYVADVQATEEARAKLREERAFYSSQGSFVYRFQTENIGFINVDVLIGLDDAPVVNLTFDFQTKSRFLDKTMLYMVNQDKKTVLSFLAADWDNIPVMDGRVYLLAVVDSSNAALVDVHSYDQLIRARARPQPFVTSLHVTTNRLPIEQALQLITSGEEDLATN